MTALSITATTSPATVTLQHPVYPIGNITICHLPADSPLQSGLQSLHNALKAHPTLSQRIHLLPYASWHMTVVDGVRGQECEPGMWPVGREKKSLAESTKEFTHKLRLLGLELAGEGMAPPYRMRVRCFDPAIVGTGIEVAGTTTEEEKQVRRLRDRLADTLGFRAPNHETYVFHPTVAYLLRHIDGKERGELNRVFAKHLPAIQREFELGAVEFCPFENMYAFPRVFYLGDKEVEE